MSDKFAGTAETSGTAISLALGQSALGKVRLSSLAELTKRRVKKKASLVTRGKPTGKGWRACRVSWYGPGFYGHGMAGGGRLKRSSMIVAHRSLPFGTRVQISYRGRLVTATVRDRGPFVAGRTFDLGPGTAKALHFSGVGRISYKIVRR